MVPDAVATPRVGDEPTEMRPDPEFMAVGERVLGRPMGVVRTAGTSDARFLSERGIPVIMSRPLSANIHRPDEWIDIASMLQYYRMLQEFIRYRLHLGLNSSLTSHIGMEYAFLPCTSSRSERYASTGSASRERNNR